MDSPADLLFYTDIPGEAAAALAAGWKAALVVRPGNAPLGEELHPGAAWGSEELQAYGAARIPVVKALTADVKPAFQ